MQCFVYRSSKKEGLYVYVSKKDQLQLLPDPVLQQLGDNAELALTFDLDSGMTLGSENPAEVLSNLSQQGYHIQMPRKIDDILARIAEDTVEASSPESSIQSTSQQTASRVRED